MNAFWVVWLVFCCLAGLVDVFKPRSAAVKPMSVVVFLGALTFLVWLTDGRLAIFAVLGFVLAHASLLLLLLVRTKSFNASRERVLRAARMLLTPALFFGGLIGAAVEFGGRWSGASFVVWRAAVGGVLVFGGGLIFAARIISEPPGSGTSPPAQE